MFVAFTFIEFLFVCIFIFIISVPLSGTLLLNRMRNLEKLTARSYMAYMWYKAENDTLGQGSFHWLCLSKSVKRKYGKIADERFRQWIAKECIAKRSRKKDEY